MATLKEEFEQAADAAKAQPERPEDPNDPIRQRLRDLHRQATEGDPSGREDAMRQYIELVGDLGGAKG